MPNRTIYIREEDLVKWEAITDRPGFIHAALNNTAPDVIQAAVVFGEEMERHKNKSDVRSDIQVAKAIDAPTLAHAKRAADLAQKPRTLCAKHGLPVDRRGNCSLC